MMQEVFNGSFGDGETTFQVLVNGPVTLDHLEAIAMIIKQAVDQQRAKLTSGAILGPNGEVMNAPAANDAVPMLPPVDQVPTVQ
jgi:hypothetical protein